MSIIGDWYDENYVVPMTKQIEEQKKLLRECYNFITSVGHESKDNLIARSINLELKIEKLLDIK
jgi:hypothetical protein